MGRLWTLLLMTAFAAQGGIEIFSKGSVSKNHLSQDVWTVNLSITAGMAWSLLPGLRVEGRYTNISELQNRVDVPSTATLTDFKTETSIYSLGLDLNLLGESSDFQPFCFLGAGYIVTTRSYYYQIQGASSAVYNTEPPNARISGNFGLGFRFRVAKSLALEIEAYGYVIDMDKPTRLINYFGTAGIRIFM